MTDHPPNTPLEIGDIAPNPNTGEVQMSGGNGEHFERVSAMNYWFCFFETTIVAAVGY